MKDNILPASVPVTLDGEAYVLRYRAYAFIFYAEHCEGGDLLADLRDVAEKLKRYQDGGDMRGIFQKLRDLLWAGLVDAQPDMPRERVARLFGLGDLFTIMPLVTRAIHMGLPEVAADRPTVPEPALQHSALTDGRDSGQALEPVAVSGV